MPDRLPDLIDNERDNTVQHWIGWYLDGSEAGASLNVAVVTAYFNLAALQGLGLERLSRLSSFRLLLGQEVGREDLLTEPMREELQQAFLRGEGQPEALRQWAAFFERAEVEIRAFQEGFLHGKAILLDGDPRAGPVGFVGSANFTAAGLTKNRELCAVLKQESAVQGLQKWFQTQWLGAKDFKQDLVSLLEPYIEQYAPADIYMKVLWERYQDRINIRVREKPKDANVVALADFQEHGYQAARGILDRYGGVIVADSVGLGKTYIAVRLLQDYRFDPRKGEYALIVAPASLIGTVWEKVLRYAGVPVEYLSMERLGREGLDLTDHQRHAKVVVVDESHNFRNADANRWGALADLLQRGCEKDVILTTATPINNSVWDLYHQVRLVVRDRDDAFAGAGIRSLQRAFLDAQHGRGTLADLLEEVMVRRSRAFIRTHYPNAEIDGKTVRFPARVLNTVRYRMDPTGDVYAEVAQVIEGLRLAPYQLDLYRKDLKGIRALAGKVREYLREQGFAEKAIEEAILTLGRQTALAYIMRVLFLKRFESSWAAIRASLERQVRFQRAFLDLLRSGYLPDGRRLYQLVRASREDDAESLELDDVEKTALDSERYDVQTLQADIEADLQALEGALARLDQIGPDQDAKLAKFHELLSSAELRGRRVIVFTSFRETAEYLFEQVRRAQSSSPEWVPGRAAILHGGMDDETRLKVIRRFAPNASGAEIPQDDQVHLLVSTDVLSEGQNLQDADTIVNYDLHWNPIRLVQRIGRLDRIGSPHEQIVIHNFYPEDRLENLLKLLRRLRDKLAQIQREVGLDAPVLGEEDASPKDFNILKQIIEGDATVLDPLDRESEGLMADETAEALAQWLKEVGQERLERIPCGVGCGKKGAQGFFAAFRDAQGRHHWLLEDATGQVTKGWTALQAIRSERGESAVAVVGSPSQRIARLRKQIEEESKRIARRQPTLHSPQNEVVNFLSALDPSEQRDSLLAFFRAPLPRRDLRDLRDLWSSTPRDDISAVLHVLAEFARVRRPASAPVVSAVSESDLELIAWMALQP